ncbi:MAG: hypothetical protein ACD_76C00095G0004 [uncultured bacterium]|nr:MAG: hypothetical protein ACD_76C00095G0004 [uncultured bacterium]
MHRKGKVMKNSNTGRSPQTQAIHTGYNPRLSEGAVKPPVFLATTFVAGSCEELALWFNQAYGLGCEQQVPSGLIYSRLVNPNAQMFEERIACLEGAQEAVLVSSGMSAISLVMDEFCGIGDVVLYSAPVYGGTDFLFKHVLTDQKRRRVRTIPFAVESTAKEVKQLIVKHHPVRMIYIESPSNPTLVLADIAGIAEVAKAIDPEILIVVDNTILSPAFQRPLELGADIVVESATKIIGGHSDVIAGVIAGSHEHIGRLKGRRTITGSICDPFAAWQLLQRMETLMIRAQAQYESATEIVKFLRAHPAVLEVLYPGSGGLEQERRLAKQCSGAGQLISFCVRGGRAEAWRVLDSLEVVQLAVSLGGTESLAEHPRTHTHADVCKEDQDQYGITENLIRLSVGLEAVDDLKADLNQAFSLIY